MFNFQASNVLDFFLVASSFLLSGVKSLRTVRILRPLRAISRNAGMRVIVDALVGSAGELKNVGIILGIVWTIFAILGVALFGATPGHPQCHTESTLIRTTWVNLTT